MSEAACLGCVWRIHDELRPWLDAAVERSPVRPALCVDGTGMRFGGRNLRLHVVADVPSVPDGGKQLPRFWNRRP